MLLGVHIEPTTQHQPDPKNSTHFPPVSLLVGASEAAAPAHGAPRPRAPGSLGPRDHEEAMRAALLHLVTITCPPESPVRRLSLLPSPEPSLNLSLSLFFSQQQQSLSILIWQQKLE